MDASLKNHGPYAKLFEPAYIKSLRIANRLMMAPMGTRLCSESGAVTEVQLAYYEERAKGGVGAIISESTAVDSPLGLTGATSMRLHDNAYLGGHNELVERIQRHGVKVFCQLVHAGRQTTPANIQGMQPVAPSPIPCGFLKVMPRELSEEEIQEIVAKFAEAALRAKTAGYDGIELHGAHGYLIDQFMWAKSNTRQDGYGGDLAGRMRFALEVVAAVRQAVGPDYPLLFRMSAVDHYGDENELAEAMERARMLERAGVDLLDVSAGSYETFATIVEPMSYGEAWKIDLAARIKEQVEIPVVGVGVIRTPATAEALLKEGKVDFVSLGRALLADSFWPQRARQGRDREINRCISCNIGCMGGRILKGLRVRCTVNPRAGREYLDREETPAKAKKVLVVGGGPAGMMAAITAARRGHQVRLAESSETLGGQLNLAAAAQGKEKIKWFLDYLAHQLELRGVSVRTQAKLSADEIMAENPDAVIIATGAAQAIPDIPGMASGKVVKAWDLLSGADRVRGDAVLVAGGGTVGAEIAAMLASRGKDVTVVEMLDALALDMEPINRGSLLAKLGRLGVKTLTRAKLVAIEDQQVLLRDLAKDADVRLAADCVVLALGSKPEEHLLAALSGHIEKCFLVGDCSQPRKIIDAVSEGYQTAQNI